MTLDFFSLVESLTSHMFAEANFIHELKSIGVNFHHWPSCRARDLALNYERLAAKDGHDFATHLLIDDALKLKMHRDAPLDVLTLRPLYRNLFKLYLAKDLARQLIHEKNGDRIDAIVASFLNIQSASVEELNFQEQLVSRLKAHSEAVKAGVGIVAIPKFASLTEAIGGFNGGRVCLLVAETGFGKTNLSLSLCRAASEVGKTLFVNMEMSADDLTDKLIMGGARIDFSTYKKTDFNNPSEIIAQKIGKLSESKLGNLYYTGGRSLSFDEISGLTRRMHSKPGGLFILFIDYDQKIKITTSRENPEWKALQIIIERLEELAKELNIYVMVMSQGNEEGGPSGSKRSAYPASTVLRFYEDESGTAILQAVKNRFGKRSAKIKLDYIKDSAVVDEIGYYQEPLPPPKTRVNYGTARKPFKDE